MGFGIGIGISPLLSLNNERGNLPVNTVAPAITGTAQEGQTLTCLTGTWTGTPIITYSYQWKRNNSNIVSATNSTYTLVTADVGQSIKCTVTATNAINAVNADSNTVIPTSSVDADAQAFITAAAITDPTQQSAINQLVVDLKGYNIWTKFKAIYPIVGGTASTHKWNLKDPRNLDAEFRLTFTNAWTHSSTGMTPNGTSAYANTFLVPSTNLSLNSTHISGYLRTNLQFAGPIISTEDAASYNNGLYIWPRQSTNLYSVRINDNGLTGAGSAPADIRGLQIATRTASNVKKYRLNNTQIFNSTEASTGLNTSSIYLGASRNNANYNGNQLAFASIGDGLTDTEASNFYTAVQAFQVTLGRSIGTQTVSDADAQAFVNAANITDQVEANAINNLVIGMKADGLWTKMKAIYPVVGGVASSHAVNLKTPGTFNLTFASGWSHSLMGMTPTNAYANTGFNPLTQSLPRNSASMGVYNRTNTVITGGHGQRVSNNFEMFDPWSDSRVYAYINNGSSGFNVAVPNSLGLFQGSRTSSTAIAISQNNTINNGSSTTTGDSNGDLWIGASNNGGTGTFFNNRQIAFFYIGEGFDNTEMQNIYTRVNTFQVTLNRNV